MSTKIVALIYVAKVNTDDAKQWLSDRFDISDSWSPGQLSDHLFVTLETVPQAEYPDGVMAAGMIAANFQDIANTLKEHPGINS